MAETVATALAPRLGRTQAHELVARCARTAATGGGTLRACLEADPEVGSVLTAEDLDAAFDPAGTIGPAGALIDRALAAYTRSHGGDGHG